jgi:hypothetical protein
MPTAFDLPTMTRVTDSGLAAALCGLGADSLRRPDSTRSGAVGIEVKAAMDVNRDDPTGLRSRV